jgi:hypothetical protein
VIHGNSNTVVTQKYLVSVQQGEAAQLKVTSWFRCCVLCASMHNPPGLRPGSQQTCVCVCIMPLACAVRQCESRPTSGHIVC